MSYRWPEQWPKYQITSSSNPSEIRGISISRYKSSAGSKYGMLPKVSMPMYPTIPVNHISKICPYRYHKRSSRNSPSPSFLWINQNLTIITVNLHCQMQRTWWTWDLEGSEAKLTTRTFVEVRQSSGGKALNWLVVRYVRSAIFHSKLQEHNKPLHNCTKSMIQQSPKVRVIKGTLVCEGSSETQRKLRPSTLTHCIAKTQKRHSQA